MANRLPNADKARIDLRKLRDYALDPNHESGQHKAAFFAQMGYMAEGWECWKPIFVHSIFHSLPSQVSFLLMARSLQLRLPFAGHLVKLVG